MKPSSKADARTKGSVQATHGDPSPARKAKKEWSLKLRVRLPHKIGRPLGNGSGSDGGGGCE